MGQVDRSLQVRGASPTARAAGARSRPRAWGNSQSIPCHGSLCAEFQLNLPLASAQFVALMFDLDDVALNLLVVGAAQVDELQPDPPLRHAGA